MNTLPARTMIGSTKSTQPPDRPRSPLPANRAAGRWGVDLEDGHLPPGLHAFQVKARNDAILGETMSFSYLRINCAGRRYPVRCPEGSSMAKPAITYGAPPSSPEVTGWTDDSLLAAYQATGAQGAFAEIASWHGAMVFGACYRRLGNVHDAEDAAQAVFIELALDRAEPVRGSLGAWLHTVADRMAVTLVRAPAYAEKRKRRFASLRPNHPSKKLCGKNSITASPGCRLDCEAVILCYLEGHKQADAARMLGCNQGTLSRWAADGLERLHAWPARRSGWSAQWRWLVFSPSRRRWQQLQAARQADGRRGRRGFGRAPVRPGSCAVDAAGK